MEKGRSMSAVSQLRTQEASCLSRIDELNRVLDSLSEFRGTVSRSLARFQDQLADKVSIAQRAGDLQGTRMAQRYAERTVGYLTGEFNQVMSTGFDEVDAQVAIATRQAEGELDEERARLASIRASIESEQIRERAEVARREAEEQRQYQDFHI